MGPYIPLYSCYILGVPCLGFPLNSFQSWCVGHEVSDTGVGGGYL